VFLDPATLEPYDDQWAYLSSIARLSAKGRDRTGPPTARPTVRTRRAPTAVADLFANCSPAGGDHPRHVCLTNHTNRQRPWPSDDLRRQACRLHTKPRIRCAPTGPAKHLGHTAFALQLRRNRRRRPRSPPRTACTADRTGRLRRQHTAHRRQAHKRRTASVRLRHHTARDAILGAARTACR